MTLVHEPEKSVSIVNVDVDCPVKAHDKINESPLTVPTPN